jgi:hypothetical protein
LLDFREGLCSLLFGNLQHRVIKEVSDALLHVRWLTIENLEIGVNANPLAKIQKAAIHDLAIGTRVAV